MKIIFNNSSARARKNWALVHFSKGRRFALGVLVSLLAVLGAALWISIPLLGGALIGVALWLLMPILWYEYDLALLKAEQISGSTVSLETALPPNVAGKVRSVSSPFGAWDMLRGTWQQRFVCSRYGLPVSMFDSLPKEKANIDSIWEEAVVLSQKHEVTGISPAAIIIALIKSSPNYQQVLGELQLDIEELETSIGWLAHVEGVIERQGAHQHYGGLARDWTSGYTPTLSALSHNMSIDVQSAGFMHRDLEAHRVVTDEMMQFLSQGRQNVVLTGEVGVGKTISVYSFAQKLMNDITVPENLQYNQVFLLNPANIVSMSGEKASIENNINHIFIEAQRAKNAILFFDDAITFFEEGVGAVDLSRVLMPILEGEVGVPVIFAMTPEQWQRVAKNNQALAGLLNQLVVNPADKEHSLKVLQDQSLLVEAKSKTTIMFKALEESYELSNRYSRDIAQPGAALRLLESSVNHAQDGVISAQSVQQSIEATQGVKVQTASSAEKEQLLSLEDQIHTRMINQTRAVKVVSDALRRSRSGVNNPDRPVGTFMFLGPTGVGKTELSKAVADVYFGSEKNMVRVDMNESTQSSDVAKLLDTDSTSSFLSTVARNPFTVVLFDEIEKAHPDVVNVFLQLLDEGVMRDDKNKEVSFKDAIVIATSNAGADSIRTYIDAGQDVEQFEKPFLDQLIDNNLFKPEFLNRFDELVVFRPLTEEELIQVVDILLIGVNKNLKKQKVSVELSKPAKRWLAKEGYDPRLGARPLRRMVQRTVENVLAKKLLSDDFVPGSTIKLEEADLISESTS